MKPRLMFGLVGVLLLLGTPAVVAAQRGTGGGFAASGMRAGAVSSGGAPHAASVIHTSSSVPNVVPVSPSVVHARAGVRAADVPSRHAGMFSTLRTQNAGNQAFSPMGPPLNRRRNPPPVTTPVGTPRVVYVLGVGGYYYAAPGDDSASAPQDAAQDSAEVEGQLADDRQAGAPIDRNGDRSECRSARARTAASRAAGTAAGRGRADAGVARWHPAGGCGLHDDARPSNLHHAGRSAPQHFSRNFRCRRNATRESRARHPDAASPVAAAKQMLTRPLRNKLRLAQPSERRIGSGM